MFYFGSTNLFRVQMIDPVAWDMLREAVDLESALDGCLNDLLERALCMPAELACARSM